MAYNIVITGDNSGAARAIKETEQALSDMEQTAKEGGGELDDMFGRIKTAAAGVFAGISAAQFISEVVKTRGEMQQLEVAFTTMLGGKAKADKLMAEMTQTAMATPFEFADVANGARQLLAYGEGADTVNETLVKLGNVSAGLSQPLNDIVYLYGTTRVQGRLFSQDLNQFTNRGIPMIQKLAEQFGVTEDKVKDLVSEGKVGFPEVEKVINDLTSEGGMFFNLMEEQSKTISGQISNLQDKLSNIFNEIGKSGEGVITSAIGGVATLLDHWEDIGKALMTVAAAYGVTRGALMAYVAVQKASAAVQAAGGVANYAKEFLGLTKALGGATSAQKAMNAAAMANPYALIAAAVTGLCYGLYKLATATDEAEEAQSKFNERVSEAQAGAEQSFDKLRELETAYTQGKIKIGEYTAELDKLKELYPDIIQAHTDEATGLLNIVEAQKEVNKAIEQRIAKEEIASVKQEMAQKRFMAMRDEMESTTRNADRYVSNETGRGKDATEANDKARRFTHEYQMAIKDAMSGFDFSQYAASGDWKRAEADLAARVKEVGKSFRGAVNSELGDYYLSHVFQKQIGEADKVFSGSIEAYVEEARQVEKARKLMGFALEDETGATKSSASAEAAGDPAKVDKLAKAWQNYFSVLGSRQESKDDADEVRRKDTELKQLREEIVLLEKSLKGHRDITAEISNWTKANDDAFSKEEAAFNNSRIAELKQRDPNAVKKEAPTEKSDTGKAELTEAQRLAIQQRRAAQIAAQAEIDAMEDGTEKKLRQINLDYERRKAAIDEGEAKLLAQAETDKRDGKGDGAVSETDAMGIANERAEAYNDYLRRTRELSQAVLSETQSYWDKRAAIIKKGQANIANIQSLEKEGLIDGKSAERRTTEVQKGTDTAVANLDMAQAQQDPAFRAWQDTLGTMALNAMKEALAKSEEVLRSLEGDEAVDDDELVRLRAKVAALKSEVSQKEANPDAERDIKDKAKLYVTLGRRIRSCVGELGDFEEAVSGTRSKATQACESMLDFGLQIVDTIMNVATGTMQAGQQTAIKTAAAIRTVESASVILAIIGAVIQAVTKMVQIFSDRSAENERLQALREYYTAVAETIDTVIDRQKELMNNATGDQVSTLKDQTNALYEQQQQQYRQAAKTRTSEYEGKNKHTVGYHENKKIKANQAQLKELTGVDIQWASDLADLSAEQLKKIQEVMPTLWASFDDTFRQMLEKIIESGEAVEELEEQAKEVRLGFSFDDLESSFKDCLADASSTAEDFAEDLEGTLRTSIINGLVYTSEIKAKLQKLYDKINATMEDEKLTDEEKTRQTEETTKEIKDLYAAADAKKQKYFELAGLDASSATEAETAGFSGMSQETAEELNGRFTAIQGHTYLINQSVAAMAGNNKAIAARMEQMASVTNTLVSLAHTRNEVMGKLYTLVSDINAKGLRLLS